MDNIKLKDKDAIIEVESELLLAMKRADINKLDDLLHDKLLFNIPNGQTITKVMDLETYGSGNMKITDIHATNQDINLIEDTAIVSTTINMKGMYFDFVIDGTYKIIRTWKLINRQWQVISGSSIQLGESN
ncbi:nuclear transport factor 2 family protein [Hyunsoonleella pacifica]|uniref:Nuclear transport factor 2 family protein n=1 Tax=Hyunsoonleella pacifica TaxID=1080224 RepID=A0A4Q9FL71_9FLAO|nr:nuclear transport factor 2 family protein [Hyunsoonleella pacifica]TBN14541.1 nuclear transport factor 2 family protein [Hyunsoonleella pacifica]GGD14645.1 hypothetical protein GCM10011368_15730 [Hyunsoonleella pacifica]